MVDLVIQGLNPALPLPVQSRQHPIPSSSPHRLLKVIEIESHYNIPQTRATYLTYYVAKPGTAATPPRVP